MTFIASSNDINDILYVLCGLCQLVVSWLIMTYINAMAQALKKL